MKEITPKNDNDCCEENYFFWPRIQAIDKEFIPPSPDNVPIVPVGTIIPTINRYFFIVPTSIGLINGATLPATLFTDDNGNTVSQFTVFSPNGYVNLFINGVMQGGGIYTVTPTALTFTAMNATISARTPIIIESLGFTTSS